MEVVTESAALKGTGSRTSRPGWDKLSSIWMQIAGRHWTWILTLRRRRVGPGAEVGTHPSAGAMSGASLSANSGQRQDSGQGQGGDAHGHTDHQPGAVDEHQPPTKKKRPSSEARAAS